MRVGKFWSRTTGNIISSELQWEKCCFLILFEFSLACNLVAYKPDHIFCCCAILRDKAKDNVAAKVGELRCGFNEMCMVFSPKLTSSLSVSLPWFSSVPVHGLESQPALHPPSCTSRAVG